MEVLVTGSGGFIGSALMTELRARGHGIRRLVRSAPGAGRVVWDPAAGTIDEPGLEGIDGVTHLAGVGIGNRRWNASHKARILDSRVRGTHLLCKALAHMKSPPRVLVSASAAGYYGDRGDETLTETSGPGSGFLAEVCKQWEESTESAQQAGIRVAQTRSGIVLSKRGGALAKLLIPFRLGVGGPLGSGRQYWPWITLRDEVRAMIHLLETDGLEGPFNLCGPAAVTQSELARALGRVLKRPSVVSAPTFAVKTALGREMATEFLLSSQRMIPQRLLESGFGFEHAEIEPALRWAVAN